jgi:hypothetical protein
MGTMGKTLNDARKYTLQRDIERQLALFSAVESIEILARATATIMSSYPSQFPHLADLFKHALDREYAYLTSRHHERGVS